MPLPRFSKYENGCLLLRKLGADKEMEKCATLCGEHVAGYIFQGLLHSLGGWSADENNWLAQRKLKAPRKGREREAGL